MSTEGEILKPSRVIAVISLSPKSDRPSYQVASYLKENGCKIIPVNPEAKDISGEPSYRKLCLRKGYTMAVTDREKERI